MASMSHLLLVLLGMSHLVNQTAAVSGGLEDALVLVQQRAQVERESATLATILADSFRANPNAHDNIIGEVVSKVGEERLQQFWEKMMEIGRTPNVSRPLRGLLLLQESGKVLGASQGNPLTEWIYDTKLYKWMMEDKSEPETCWVTRAGLLADIGDLTIAIAYPMGKSCSKTSLCVASAFDVVRALVYTIREITASRFSYCASSVSTRKLCGASSLGVFGELAGVLHSSISLEYKCDSKTYQVADSSSKMFGVNARAFMCSWDITRGAAYAIAGIYRAFWWYFLGGSDAVYVNDEGRFVRKVRGVEEIGQSGPSYGLMALGGFAWMTNSIIAGVSHCPDDSGTSTSKNSGCSKEAAELTAYAFQLLGYLQNFRDYCRDSYGKNEARDEAGNEEAFRNLVREEWEKMRKHVPEKLTEDDVKLLIEEFFNEEAGNVLKGELQVEQSIDSDTQPRRFSMNPSDLRDLAYEAIEKGRIVQDPRVSVSKRGNSNRLSVPHPSSHRLSVNDPKVQNSDHSPPNELPFRSVLGHRVPETIPESTIDGKKKPSPLQSSNSGSTPLKSV